MTEADFAERNVLFRDPDGGLDLRRMFRTIM